MTHKIKFLWETINKIEGTDAFSITARAKVFGGWIVKNVSVVRGESYENMLFIADSLHEWEIE